MRKFKDNSFDTEFKPRKVDTDIGYGFKKLDNDTVMVERPHWIAGGRVFRLDHKNHKVTTCNFCQLPAIWYDKRIRNQFNECQQCGTVNEFIVHYPVIKKRIVKQFPVGYLDRSPYRF